eukprot:TRINITY_DN77814_c0_g3_i1.p1 TRINITY_DN77814_c0_g3~~TRINITY_DN77814_c0_g3_i1.p1  ORF type:complete len:143 (-),score=23.35 TRINITY_DN77814_c0_g3_i1:32-397(-)
MVAQIGKGMLVERMKLANDLWAVGIKAELLPRENAKIQAQLKYAEENGITFAAIIGSSEIETGVVTIKNLVLPDKAPGKQFTIKRSELGTELKKIIADFEVEAAKKAEEATADVPAPKKTT